MPSIEEQLNEFNKKLYNAGFYFRTAYSNSDTLLIESSFNLMQYIQVHIYFRDVFFTNIEENENWSDAYHDDQLYLVKGEYREIAIEKLNLKSVPDSYSIFQFMVDNWNTYQSGLVIAKELEIVYLKS